MFHLVVYFVKHLCPGLSPEKKSSVVFLATPICIPREVRKSLIKKKQGEGGKKTGKEKKKEKKVKKKKTG